MVSKLFFAAIVCLVIVGVSAIATTCPSLCFCDNTTSAGDGYFIVDCSRRRFTAIPPASEFPEKTIEINFEGNIMREVNILDTFAELKRLDVPDCGIESIDKKAFDNNPTIEHLDLSSNKISELFSGTFDRLKDLKSLNLSSNQLTRMPDNIFNNLNNLEELRLSHNKFPAIKMLWFESTPQLAILDISAMELYQLADEVFHNSPSLTTLDISGNLFTVVPITALRGAKNLKILTLDGNPIKKLDEHSFIKLTSLEELYVSSIDAFTVVGPMTFSPLEKLKKLVMTNNPHLIAVDKTAFYGIYNSTSIHLAEVNLRGNRLHTLDQQLLPWCRIRILNLRENPWLCDCHLKWIKMCHERVELFTAVRCSQPAHIGGLEVAALGENDLLCPSQTDSSNRAMVRFLVFLFATVVLFFTGLIIALVLKRKDLTKWLSSRRSGAGAIYYFKAPQTSPSETGEI